MKLFFLCRFDGPNFDSEVFFLSHCHKDHMIGLGNANFQKMLQEENRFLYLSHISAEIIKGIYPAISDNLIELDLYNSNKIIFLSSGKSFCVIPIPAGHCPGSVMFLFESDRTVLYTGDFRINPRDVPKFKAFYNFMNVQKKIDKIYLDTTFFLKDYREFPSREYSMNEVCDIISHWLRKGENYAIGLNCSAKYGYEYLFIEIAKKIKMPIHVNDEVFDFYSHVPNMDCSVTRNKNKTKIHSACGLSYKDVCAQLDGFHVKTIKISAMRWKCTELETGISENAGKTHFVCYSTHASYEEIAGLLEFLKPTEIEANVLHSKQSVNDEILKNLAEFANKPQPASVKKVKLFNVPQYKVTEEEEKEDLKDEFNLLDSPPRKYKS